MRIDYEYLGEIFNIFLESERPTANWNDFKDIIGDDEHKFVFHIEIMVDRFLIASTLENGSIGIMRTNSGYAVGIVEWRLTAEGHDFAAALTKPSILDTIKGKFQQEGLSAVIDIAKKIVSKQAERLLEE